ncbi:MAG TPA: transcription initiation factor TFIIIB [Bacillota bacterium]|jgi:predicted  nucleic acid-binding Zn-ribbon protein|nr:transcription initiation factor TFIIIB [Bacillota bacterium]
MESKEKCPECGCNEIGRGKMSGHACIVPEGRVFASSALIAEVCTDCGLVLRLKVEKPHKFKQK